MLFLIFLLIRFVINESKQKILLKTGASNLTLHHYVKNVILKELENYIYSNVLYILLFSMKSVRETIGTADHYMQCIIEEKRVTKSTFFNENISKKLEVESSKYMFSMKHTYLYYLYLPTYFLNVKNTKYAYFSRQKAPLKLE